MENRNKARSEHAGQPKKSIVVRVLVLIVAALMFFGTIAFSFITAFNTR